MADITVTSAQVKRVYPDRDNKVYDVVASSAVTAGQPVYCVTSTGKYAPARGTAAGTAQVRGIAITDAAAGETFAMLVDGWLAGFTLTSQNYDDRIYLSDTASGILADSAGTVSIVIGRVVRAQDSSGTKLLHFFTHYEDQVS